MTKPRNSTLDCQDEVLAFVVLLNTLVKAKDDACSLLGPLMDEGCSHLMSLAEGWRLRLVRSPLDLKLMSIFASGLSSVVAEEGVSILIVCFHVGRRETSREFREFVPWLRSWLGSTNCSPSGGPQQQKSVEVGEAMQELRQFCVQLAIGVDHSAVRYVE